MITSSLLQSLYKEFVGVWSRLLLFAYKWKTPHSDCLDPLQAGKGGHQRASQEGGERHELQLTLLIKRKECSLWKHTKPKSSSQQKFLAGHFSLFLPITAPSCCPPSFSPVSICQWQLGVHPALHLLPPSFPTCLAPVLLLICVSQKHLERLKLAWQC